MTTYSEFLASKRRRPPSSGIDCQPSDIDSRLFEFQRHIVAWAVRRGRAAVWADTGLGKTRMQVAWADQVTPGGSRAKGLILAPLAVAEQTVREAAQIGVQVTYVRDQAEADSAPGRIVITNYDRLHKIDPTRFVSVVLDESSILKAFSGATKRTLVEAFARTPYRLACSATPAPNDIEELCNHADFLGVMTPQEMRTTFFIADSRGEFMRYRIKGHARTAFYDWLSTWAIACRTPADLGFDPTGYDLPPLQVTDHVVPTGWTADGELFTVAVKGITQQAQVRRDTLAARVKTAVDLMGRPGQWIAWCGLNDEQDAIATALGGACVSIDGRTPYDDKIRLEQAWRSGQARVLVTKPKVMGWGMNWQHCHQMVFVGLSYSYEAYYQAIRRCYRFGQTSPVAAHIVLADVESDVAATVRAKERQAAETTAGLVAAIAAENRRELFAGTSKGDDYEPRHPLTIPSWLEAAS